MADENTNSTQAETTSANSVIVPVPEPGQRQTVTLEAGQIPQLNFDPGTESTQDFVGADLVFTFDNGAVLVFEDFAADINDGEVSAIMLADGSIIPVDVLMTAWNLEVPETAAGAAAVSGGGSRYVDDMGDALTGIDKLGVQDPDPFGAATLLAVEDEQTPIVLDVGVEGIEIADVVVNEGEDAVFNVSISGAAAGSTVTLTLADGTAIDADYNEAYFEYSSDGGTTWTAVTGAIGVAAGDSSLLVRTDTFDDTLDEPDETFTLNATLTSQGTDYADSATATIIDNDGSDPGNAEAVNLTVQEAQTTDTDSGTIDFAPGSDALTSMVFSGTVGSITGDYADAAITWSGADTATLSGTVDGEPGATIVLTLTGINLATGDATVTVTMSDEFKHVTGNDSNTFTINGIEVVVTDTDLTEATGLVNVTVVDDIPTVNIVAAVADGTQDTDTVAEDAASPLSGTWTSSYGADTDATDDATAPATIKVTVGGDTTEYDLDTLIDTGYGELSVNSDGSWSFDPVSVVQPRDVAFTVTITDADGDVRSDTHTITITDGSDPGNAEAVNLTVQEAQTTDTDSGTIDFAPGSDALTSMVFSGTVGSITGDYADAAITWSGADTATLSGTVDGEPGATIVLTLTGINLATGDATVTVTMSDEFKHVTGNDSNTFTINGIEVVVTDTDLTEATGLVNVTVVDDIPTVNIVAAVADGTPDTDTVAEDAASPLSGTWTSSYGADTDATDDATAPATIKVTVGGDTTEYDLDTLIDTGYGELSVNSDGSWSFDPVSVVQPRDVAFTVTITDADGDVRSDTHTITITDGSDPGNAEAVNLTVQEAQITDTDSGTIDFAPGSDALTSMVFSGTVGSITGDYADAAITWSGADTATLSGTVDGEPGATIVLTLTGINLATGDATVTVTMSDEFKHVTGNDSNTFTINGIEVVVTDTDLTEATGLVNVTVVDDIPTVNIVAAVADGTPDTDTVAEDAASPLSGTWTSSYGADTDATDDATAPATIKVTVGGDTTEYDLDTLIDTGYGELSVNSDGSWSFDPVSVVQPRDVAFTVTITDADGDVRSDTHTITITDGSDPGNAEAVNLTVQEAQITDTDSGTIDFAPGSDALTSMVFSGTVGSITGDYADAAITWSGADTATLSGTVDGEPGATIVLTLTGINLATGDATVTVTMSDEFKHVTGNDSNTFTINGIEVVVTDTDLTEATGLVNVTVVDDIPTVNIVAAVADGTPDTDTVAEDAASPLSGTWTSSYGADTDATDDATAPATIKVTVGGDTTEYDLDTLIDTGYGELSVNSDGSWSFDPVSVVQPRDVAFTVTITDADGDVRSDTHTITITDGSDPGNAEAVNLTVQEAQITDTDSGTIDFAPGSDALTSMVFSGTVGSITGDYADAAITWSGADTATLSGTVDGEPGATIVLTLTGINLATGDATVTVTMSDEFKHVTGNDSNTFTINGIEVVVTDTDLTEATGLVNVTVVDDIPTVNIVAAVADGTPDTDTVAEDAASPLSGTWTSSYGADTDATDDATAPATIKVTVGGDTTEYDLDTLIDTGYGELSVNSDGSWSFDPVSVVQPRDVAFTVTITDADGDVRSDTHTITITDGSDPGNAEAVNLTVQEAQITDTDSGTIDFAPGSDALTSMVFSGTVGSITGDYADAAITWSGADTATLSGTVDGEPGATIVLTLTGINLATGDATVTVTMSDEFKHVTGNDSNTFTINGIEVVVTDTDLTEATGLVNVTVVDDIPTVNIVAAVADGTPDTDTVAEDAASPLSGTWTSSYGADTDATDDATAPATIKVTVGGDTTEYDLDTLIDTGYGELSVNSDGSWSFDPVSVVQPRDVAFTVTITDADGDVRSDTHTITITDGSDPGNAEAVNLTVQEAQITDTDSGTIDFAPGSDALTSMVFSGTVGSITGDYADAAITWSGADTATLSGTVDGEPGATIVLTLTGINLATGDATVTVTMSDEFKHVTGNDSNTFTINGIEVVVTDTDLTEATGLVNVTVVDDIPTLGTFMTGTIPNEAGAVTGLFDLDPGADGINNFNITGPALAGVTYSSATATDSNGIVTTTLTASAGADTLFTLDVHDNGTYTFNLVTPEAATEETISLSELSAGGPGFRELEDDPTTLLNEAGRIEFTSNGVQDGVNSNGTVFGVDNLFVDPGQWFQMEFHDPGTLGDDPSTFNAQYLQAVEVNLIPKNNTGVLTVTWETLKDGVAVDNGSFTFDNDIAYKIESSGEFNQLKITSDPNNANVTGVDFQVLPEVTIFQTILPSDQDLAFAVTAVDGDGDVTSSSLLDIHVVAEISASSFTLTGTDGVDDAIAGSTLVDTIAGGSGFDIVDYSDSTEAISVNLDASGNASGTPGDLLNPADGTIGGGDATGDSLSGVEGIIGGLDDDVLVGNDSGNYLSGGFGSDTLSGEGGSDTLVGGDGLDILVGGDGNDILFGGAGNDNLTGGNDADVFGYTGPVNEGSDTITDFDPAEDALRFYDVLEAEEDLFLDEVTISADSSINADVTLTTDAGTSITIEGINVDSGSGGPFDGYTSLGDFLGDNPAAITVDFDPDNFGT